MFGKQKKVPRKNFARMHYPTRGCKALGSRVILFKKYLFIPKRHILHFEFRDITWGKEIKGRQEEESETRH